MTNVQKLNLSNNFLGSINSKTFQNLEKLEVLDLSYNHIRVLGDQSFQALPSLLNLNLTGNALESVHEFATLPNLKKLYLGENRISSLTSLPNIAKNLTTLDLEFNRLKNLSDLYTILREFPQIEKIFLRGNMFSMCHNQRQIVVSDKLQLLNLELSTMQLIWSEGKCFNVFNNLQQLEQLSLASNGLQSLPRDIFKDLASLLFWICPSTLWSTFLMVYSLKVFRYLILNTTLFIQWIQISLVPSATSACWKTSSVVTAT